MNEIKLHLKTWLKLRLNSVQTPVQTTVQASVQTTVQTPVRTVDLPQKSQAALPPARLDSLEGQSREQLRIDCS